MAGRKGGDQFDEVGLVGLGGAADAEAVAGVDVIAQEVDPIEALLATAAAQELQGRVGVQLEVAGLGVDALGRHGSRLEVEIGQQQGGMDSHAAQILGLQPAAQQSAQRRHPGGARAAEDAAEQMDDGRGLEASGVPHRGQQLPPGATLGFPIQIDPAHHRRPDRRAPAESHIQLGLLFLPRKEAIESVPQRGGLAAQDAAGEHLRHGHGVAEALQGAPVAVGVDLGAGEGPVRLAHGGAQRLVAPQRGLGSLQQGALVIRVHEEGAQPRRGGGVVGEGPTGLQVDEGFEALGAGSAHADGEELHLSGLPERSRPGGERSESSSAWRRDSGARTAPRG